MKYIFIGQETERLTFRLLKPEDFDAWVPLFQATNIAEYLQLDPKLSAVELTTLVVDENEFYG